MKPVIAVESNKTYIAFILFNLFQRYIYNKIYNDYSEILMNLSNRDTKVLNKIKEEFKKKLKDLDNNQKPFNYFNIFPLVILIIIIWIFIILFLLKLLHHFFANVYIYILLTIIIFILLFGSLWFLYTNNDLL